VMFAIHFVYRDNVYTSRITVANFV